MCDAWLCQNALIFHGPKIITSVHPMAGTIDHIAAEQRRWQTLLHLIHQGNHPQNPKNITYCKLRVFFSCFDPNSESLGTTEKHGFHGILELFSIMKSTMDFFEAKKNRQISLKSSAFGTTLSAHHRTNSSKAIDLHLLTWQLQQLTAFVVLTIGICSAREGNVQDSATFNCGCLPYKVCLPKHWDLWHLQFSMLDLYFFLYWRHHVSLWPMSYESMSRRGLVRSGAVNC